MGGANTQPLKANYVTEQKNPTGNGYNDDYYNWSKNIGRYEKQNTPLNPSIFPYEESKSTQVTATSPIDRASVYSAPVQADRERVIQKGFDPEGSDYDYITAENAGIKPNNYNRHMGSVAPVTEDVFKKYKQYGLPEGESYMILKGATHPTHSYTVAGEAERGFEIKKFGDRYFSVPKQKLAEDAIEQGLSLSGWMK